MCLRDASLPGFSTPAKPAAVILHQRFPAPTAQQRERVLHVGNRRRALEVARKARGPYGRAEPHLQFNRCPVAALCKVVSTGDILLLISSEAKPPNGSYLACNGVSFYFILLCVFPVWNFLRNILRYHLSEN